MHPNALLDLGAELMAQVLTFEHPADAVLAQFARDHRQLGSRERHQLGDIVYTVLREKPRLEWLLKQVPYPVEAGAVASPAKPVRAGAKGARVPPPRSPRFRALALLALQSASGELSDGVAPAEREWLSTCEALQASAAAKQPPECSHLLPTWLAERLQAQVGEGFDALAHALNEPAALDLRVNLLKAKRPAVLQALADAGLAASPTPYSPWGIRLQGKPSLHKLPVYADGQIEVQDEGSQLLALLLEPKRTDVVIDFCAGAGGKTLALGAAMRNMGRLYAFDTSAHRLEGLQPRLKRSGLSNVHTMVIQDERDERLKRMIGKADRVLVDAPCSGLGTLRRSPDLKWRQKPEAVAALAELQSRILASAARLLKPGGRLIYATCSLLPEENEAVADAFTRHHREFEPLPVAPLLAHAGIESPEPLTKGGYLRLWPHLHATDGFFAAVWQQKA